MWSRQGGLLQELVEVDVVWVVVAGLGCGDVSEGEGASTASPEWDDACPPMFLARWQPEFKGNRAAAELDSTSMIRPGKLFSKTTAVVDTARCRVSRSRLRCRSGREWKLLRGQLSSTRPL